MARRLAITILALLLFALSGARPKVRSARATESQVSALFTSGAGRGHKGHEDHDVTNAVNPVMSANTRALARSEGYQAYGVALNAEVLPKYGAKFLVRSGTFEAVEGRARDRNIVLEFKDYATTLACYRSPEYGKAKVLRAGAVDIDIIVIEATGGSRRTDTRSGMESVFGQQQRLGSTISDRERSGR